MFIKAENCTEEFEVLLANLFEDLEAKRCLNKRVNRRFYHDSGLDRLLEDQRYDEKHQL